MGFDYIGFLSKKMMAAKELGVYPSHVMFWLLYAWNSFHRKEGFRLTDKQLSELTGIKSRATLLDAKKKLEASGLIRYMPCKKRHGTFYWMETI